MKMAMSSNRIEYTQSLRQLSSGRTKKYAQGEYKNTKKLSSISYPNGKYLLKYRDYYTDQVKCNLIKVYHSWILFSNEQGIKFGVTKNDFICGDASLKSLF